MKRPWMKFYPSDWRSDPRLRMCSIGARGLWMEMICLMHEAEPYGHLVSNSAPISCKNLAKLCGISVSNCMKFLLELASSGVYSLTDEKIIFSRRMLKDKEKYERDRENGREGGNPSLLNGVNPPVKAQKLEARSQIPEEEKESCTVAKATRTKNEYSKEFEEQFWNPYPRTPTMAKLEAWKVWVKLSPDERAKACKAIGPYRQFLKTKPNLETVHACRFLSQRRFEGFSDIPPPAQIFDIRSHLV